MQYSLKRILPRCDWLARTTSRIACRHFEGTKGSSVERLARWDYLEMTIPLSEKNVLLELLTFAQVFVKLLIEIFTKICL
jgi:hypothetical protein